MTRTPMGPGSARTCWHIRGKVTSVDVFSTKNSIKVLGTKVEDGEDVVLGKIEEERAVETYEAKEGARHHGYASSN